MDLRTLLFGRDHRIGRRLTVQVMGLGLLIALCLSAVQVLSRHRDLRLALDRQLDDIGAYAHALEGSVWDFDQDQIQRSLDALVLVPDVAMVRVTTDTGRQWTAGQVPPADRSVSRSFTLRHDHRGKPKIIGTLEVVASLDGIRQQVLAGALSALLGNALTTALVAIFLVFLIRRLVTSRLERMALQVRELIPVRLPATAAGPAAAAEVPRGLDELGAVEWALGRTAQELDDAVRALQESEEQRRQSQKLEAVGQLAAGVAHDFNNLLTAMMADAEMLVDGLGQGELRDGALEIQAAARRAALLTRQLLAFGRRQAAQPQVVDLNEIVASMDRLLRRLIGEEVELTTVPAAGLERVLADPGQIEQVLVNLVVNARDAMPGGGRILIETANAELSEADRRLRSLGPDPYVRLSVSDTGSGISAEVRAHLFEPFFTTKEPGKGTGLGLSTAYGIVKQCGGDIRAESEPGRGTTFEVLLPRAPEGAQERVADGNAARPARGTETILVLDDDHLVRATTVRALRSAGYGVLAARDSEEAFRLLAGAPGGIDLLVSDVVLPHMSGPEVAARLRVTLPRLPVLFVSGYTDRAVDLEALGQPVAFLPKPFTGVELTRRARELLDRPV